MTRDEAIAELGMIEAEVAAIHSAQVKQQERLVELVARRDELLHGTGQASFGVPAGGNIINVPTATIHYKAQV